MSCASLTKITTGLKSCIGNLFKFARISDKEVPVDQLTQTTNPWQEELDRLLVNDVKQPEIKASGDLASANLPDIYRKNKPKRPADATVKDLKAWWSESIATWEPGADKPVGPNGQKSRQSGSAHWFQ